MFLPEKSQCGGGETKTHSTELPPANRRRRRIKLRPLRPPFQGATPNFARIRARRARKISRRTPARQPRPRKWRRKPRRTTVRRQKSRTRKEASDGRLREFLRARRLFQASGKMPKPTARIPKNRQFSRFPLRGAKSIISFAFPFAM